MSSVFSFRAECMQDVYEFATGLHEAGIRLVSWTMTSDDARLPDVACEFAVEQDDVEIAEMIAVTNDIVDIHVLHETLRPGPLSENSLERRTVPD